MRNGSTSLKFNAPMFPLLLATTLFFAGGQAQAADPERGKLLYENHCRVCHTSVVHVREDRKASSREEIRTWIQRWRKELGLQWGSAEIDDVIEYLNDRYYRLDGQS